MRVGLPWFGWWPLKPAIAINLQDAEMTEPLDFKSNYTGGDYVYLMGGDGFENERGR